MAEKRKGKRRRDEVRAGRSASYSAARVCRRHRRRTRTLAYRTYFNVCVCVRCFSRNTAWTPRTSSSPAKSSILWPRGCANKCRTRRPSSPDTTSNILRVRSGIPYRFCVVVSDPFSTRSLSLVFVFRLVGSKAVDSLLESKWVTSEKWFTTRQEIEMFLDL